MNLQISWKKLQIRVGPLTNSFLFFLRKFSGSRFLKIFKDPAGRIPKRANELGQALDQFLWIFKNCSLQVKTSLMLEDNQGAHISYPFIPTGCFFEKRAHHPTLVHFISQAKPRNGAWLFNSEVVHNCHML
jgi:hypothetical protein